MDREVDIYFYIRNYSRYILSRKSGYKSKMGRLQKYLDAGILFIFYIRSPEIYDFLSCFYPTKFLKLS